MVFKETQRFWRLLNFNIITSHTLYLLCQNGLTILCITGVFKGNETSHWLWLKHTLYKSVPPTLPAPTHPPLHIHQTPRKNLALCPECLLGTRFFLCDRRGQREREWEGGRERATEQGRLKQGGQLHVWAFFSPITSPASPPDSISGGQRLLQCLLAIC